MIIFILLLSMLMMYILSFITFLFDGLFCFIAGRILRFGISILWIISFRRRFCRFREWPAVCRPR